MSKTTMLDMYRLAARESVPLLFKTEVLTEFPFLQEYFDNFKQFDQKIAMTYASQYPIWNVELLQKPEYVWNQFQNDCAAVMRYNNFNMRKLFALCDIEYNPLENYNRKESIEDTSSEDETNKNNYGEQTFTENLGEREINNDYGEQSNQNNRGAQSITNDFGDRSSSTTHGAESERQNYGKQKQESEDGVAGYNSSSYANSTKSTQNVEAHMDTKERDAVTDNVTEKAYTNMQDISALETTEKFGAHSDKVVHKAVENNKSQAAHLDELQRKRNATAKRVATISGNIGVTTSQKMFNSEWELIRTKNPYDAMMYLISKDLLIFYDAGWSAMDTPYANENFESILLNEYVPH